MNESLKQQIAEYLELESNELASDTILEELENWDSVAALTIMVMLGDEIGVPVMPNEIKQLKTFGDIENLVAFKKQQAASFKKEV